MRFWSMIFVLGCEPAKGIVNGGPEPSPDDSSTQSTPSESCDNPIQETCTVAFHRVSGCE